MCGTYQERTASYRAGRMGVMLSEDWPISSERGPSAEAQIELLGQSAGRVAAARPARRAGVWCFAACVLALWLVGCGGRKLPEPGNAPLPTTPPSPVSPPSRPPP